VEFSIKSGHPAKASCDCIVVGVFDSRKLSVPAQELDKVAGGHLAGILRRGDMDGKSGSTLLVHGTPGIAAERVLLVGLGKEAEFGEKAYRDALAAAVRALKDTGSKNITITLSELPVPRCNAAWRVRQGTLVVHDVLYRSDQLKSQKDNASPSPAAIAFSVAGKDARSAAAALMQGNAIAQGMNLTRELGNLPANICTPTYLAQQAHKLAKAFKLECEVLDRARMEKLGMGSLLAVGRGSHQPPRFIVLQYRGGKARAKPVVLVGKGITFDTGGISLKPGERMGDMKSDMGGAAAVLGAMESAARLNLPLRLIGITPCTENMPDAGAYRPADVITAANGKTIEIISTDAEGRMVLADALVYAEHYKPAAVIDLATLTGACVIALGSGVAAGIFSNNDGLRDRLLAAAGPTFERLWPLPLYDDYRRTINSEVADMKNSGGRFGGVGTAAVFLREFTNYPWAHLDIAGVALSEKAGDYTPVGGTGFGVRVLVEYLRQLAAGER